MTPQGPETLELDHAATSPLDAAVLDEMLPYLRSESANPSSVHAPGVRVRAAVERARERVLEAVAGGAGRGGTVTFTSGGTEANNLAVLGFVRARRTDRVVVSAVEHPSVRNPAAVAAEEAGVPCVAIPTDPAGSLDLDRFAEALGEKTTFVALIHGQNETGVVQPIAAAARVVRARAPRAHLHVDAIQSFGKIPIDDVAAVADSIAVSAHKIHGPKGVGALVRFGGRAPVPLVFGGGQEGGVRSGTENVPGIVGLGAAASRAAAALSATTPALAALAAGVVAAFEALDGAVVLGRDAAERLPSIVAAAVAGVRGEVLQHHLEEEGIVVGTGSACASSKSELSPTYAALGLNEAEARSVIRVG
ncbi:MAG: cysteine desulfurase family protein, partial [Planctomycetota bacterium JB042]